MEDATCRYCFEGDGELLSDVCDCRGDQRFVHLTCLRQWQRMVVVNQPTHPIHCDHDVRQQRCNVCGAEFRCKPPTRFELMSSFAGDAVTTLVAVGSWIANRVEFDGDDEDEHWRQSAYLIVGVDRGTDTYRLVIESTEELSELRKRRFERDGEARVSFMGKAMQVVRGSLDDEPPLRLVLKDLELSEGDESIVAVNLSRPKLLNSGARLRFKLAERKAWRQLARRFGIFCAAQTQRSARFEHYIGGPMDTKVFSYCVVVRDGAWNVAANLVQALIQASVYVRRSYQKARILPGTYARLCFPGQPQLDGKLILVMAQDEEKNIGDSNHRSNGWLVRLAATDMLLEDAAPFPAATSPHVKVMAVGQNRLIDAASTKSQLQQDVDVVDAAPIAIYVFWGSAAWSRTQLLAETARGHWGLCRARVDDLKKSPASSRRPALEERLVVAPISAMTDAAVRGSS